MSLFSIRSLEAFTAKFSRLQKRAVKLGLEMPSFQVLGQRLEQAEVFEISEGGSVRKPYTETVIVHDIDVTAPAPIRLNGWTFSARIESAEGRNLVFSLPDEKVDERFFFTGSRCEHCNLARNRKDTFVVSHEDGTQKQVGRTCLADFCGHLNAETLADRFTFTGTLWKELQELRDSELSGWEGGQNRGYSVGEVISLSLALQDRYGWTSAQKARDEGGTSTAERVSLYLGIANIAERTAHMERAGVTMLPLHSDKAQAVIDYWVTMDVDLANSYAVNLQTLCRQGFCSRRSMGLVVSAPAGYARAQAMAVREQARARSQWVGNAGDKVPFVATVERVMAFPDHFSGGTSYKTILRTEGGDVLTLSCVKVDGEMAKEGDKVSFVATVKGHSEYEGEKQTALLRATKGKKA